MCMAVEYFSFHLSLISSETGVSPPLTAVGMAELAEQKEQGIKKRSLMYIHKMNAEKGN